MAQKTLTTSYLAQLTNANHDGVTQQLFIGGRGRRRAGAYTRAGAYARDTGVKSSETEKRKKIPEFCVTQVRGFCCTFAPSN